MYCVRCGAELSDSEEKCPLCGTIVFHPDIPRPQGEKPYPVDTARQETASRAGVLFLLTMGFVLPLWFKKPIPVVFVSADFAALGLFLLYIDFATHGHWFLTFALPVTGGLMLIADAAVTLLCYVRRGRLYIYAGTLLVTGGFMVLVEFLLNLTFGLHDRLMWSLYPLAACTLLGITLLVIALCPPMREGLRRKFFL